MQTIKDTMLNTLQTIRDHIEARDEAVKKRDNCFLQPPVEPEDGFVENEDLKRVSLDLLDIGVFYANGAVTHVKALPLY